MNIKQLQTALKVAGFDPGPLDGAYGPKTRTAIVALQARHGLTQDGIAGPRTQAVLSQHPSSAPHTQNTALVPAALPWLAEAVRLIGTSEIVGVSHNRTILDWAKAARISYAEDETPWCGLFVAHCITAALPDEPIPANPLGARKWMTFGREVAPQLGAVMVFWRGSKDGWLGHVSLYWAEDARCYYVLGGNQSDTVNITKLDKSRLLGARWPHAVTPTDLRRSPSGAPVALSTNEA